MDQPSGSCEAAPRMPNPRCGYSSWAASSHPTATIKNHLKNSIKELKEMPHLNKKKNSSSWCLILAALPRRNRKKANNTSHKRAFDLFIVPPDEELRAPLEAADLAEGHGSRAEAVRLPRSAGMRGRRFLSCRHGAMGVVHLVVVHGPGYGIVLFLTIFAILLSCLFCLWKGFLERKKKNPKFFLSSFW